MKLSRSDPPGVCGREEKHQKRLKTRPSRTFSLEGIVLKLQSRKSSKEADRMMLIRAYEIDPRRKLFMAMACPITRNSNL